MIHNGIEYGLMQSYAEEFDILRHASEDALPPEHRYAFDLAEIAEVWRRGSVVSSWLLDLTAAALTEDPLPALTDAAFRAEMRGHVATAEEEPLDPHPAG